MGFSDFINILRPLNCIMAAFGTFIGYCIASGYLVQFDFWIGIAMAVAFLVCAGGMVVNDFFDRAVDKKLHPEKPIPSGRIAAKTALLYAGFLFFSGNLLAFKFLPGISFAIALAFTALLILYSMFLSKAKFIGNFVVASGTAFTLIFGASLLGNYAIVAWLAFAALLANLARELIKDLQDMEADKGHKKSLPMLMSGTTVNAIIFIYYLGAIAAVYVPAFFLSFNGAGFVAIASIANLLFLYSFALALKKKFGKAQLFSKIAMLIALIGFLFGVV